MMPRPSNKIIPRSSFLTQSRIIFEIKSLIRYLAWGSTEQNRLAQDQTFRGPLTWRRTATHEFNEFAKYFAFLISSSSSGITFFLFEPFDILKRQLKNIRSCNDYDLAKVYDLAQANDRVNNTILLNHTILPKYTILVNYTTI